MLNFRGTVISGLKKAGTFMQKEVYQKQYLKKLGFVPYNGTLNVKLNEDIEINLKEKYENQLKIINGNETLGDVYFLNAELSDLSKKHSQKGAILFPTKTVHKLDTIEFIAEKNLRENMNLKDNTEVIITIYESNNR
jgi:riboflavin kinase